ncbi:hypothetical protein K435DRAFT_799488 [Dendrothele bispora CBS 962.96]|uniref:Uncharacterized protein n=1 Tax=Dendrothele bispora (strain CBS 962.96) TaxID=1314807 RepID=A0A4S8LW54_DENBC|nr:hypothetical protein K435DRAFT_799488 [Dendrothele bispora CBS 962.96]
MPPRKKSPTPLLPGEYSFQHTRGKPRKNLPGQINFTPDLILDLHFPPVSPETRTHSSLKFTSPSHSDSPSEFTSPRVHQTSRSSPTQRPSYDVEMSDSPTRFPEDPMISPTTPPLPEFQSRQTATISPVPLDSSHPEIRDSKGRTQVQAWMVSQEVAVELVEQQISEEFENVKPTLYMKSSQISIPYIENWDVCGIIDSAPTPTFTRILRAAIDEDGKYHHQPNKQALERNKIRRSLITAQIHYSRSHFSSQQLKREGVGPTVEKVSISRDAPDRSFSEHSLGPMEHQIESWTFSTELD